MGASSSVPQGLVEKRITQDIFALADALQVLKRGTVFEVATEFVSVAISVHADDIVYAALERQLASVHKLVLLFLRDVERWRILESQHEAAIVARQLFKTYLEPGAQHELSLPKTMGFKLEQCALASDGADRSIFDEAKAFVSRKLVDHVVPFVREHYDFEEMSTSETQRSL